MALIIGTDDSDVLDGTPEDDFLLGLTGNDQTTGGEGRDRLFANDGGEGMDVATFDDNSTDFTIGGPPTGEGILVTELATSDTDILFQCRTEPLLRH